MSAAVCLLASLLSCPYPHTGARLQPTTEHTQSIKRERLGNPPTPIAARFGPYERFGTTDPQIPIPFIFSKVDENQELEDPYPYTGARHQPTTEHTQSIKRERLGNPPTPIVARFGPDERFGITDPQIPIPFIFSKVDKNQELEDQEPRYKVSSVDKPRQKLKTRTKIILKTTETKTVETAYVEQTPLEEQWRLSSLFGIRNAATTLSQPIPSVSGIEMGKPGYQEVMRAAKIHQVPVDLALRVAKQESRGNCGAKSSAGALGVMQVMPGTGAKHGYSTKQLSNCRTGAEAGVKELKHLLRLSGGDVKQTLTGYNCGEKCMFGRRKKLPLETVNYIQVVTRN
jgi:Transglycosylase SLT domain